MSFDFSGTAILSVEAADDSAVILDMNSRRQDNKKGDTNKMDEKTLNLIVDSMKNTITETLAKNTEYETEISELNQTVAGKSKEINELTTEIDKIKKAIADLENERETWRAERDTLEKMLGEAKAKQRIAEMNEAVKDFTEEQKEYAKEEIEKFNADPVNVEINTIVTKIYEGIGK